MSQSPYMYYSKNNRQGYDMNDQNTSGSLSGTPIPYGSQAYPQYQNNVQRQSSAQQTPQAQNRSAYTPQQGGSSAQPYGQYDSSQQQQQQQLSAGSYAQGSQQPQYPQMYQQAQVPQQKQQYNAGAALQYNPQAYPYQAAPNAYAAPAPNTYGYAVYPGTVPVSQEAGSQGQVPNNFSGARAPLPLPQASLVDPNQVPQRPKLTTTFWEDEGTVCYQVESRGISVSRREDTNFINGTKLLNVAGMTRGRRDGILKSEKVRYVVKIGAMNLKGVWIPFERALELARNEGIIDLLYPLFVKDIKELYQGPQFSGGLTAAANSNPKNIIPVQVTNTAYTAGAYSAKDKKSKKNASA